MIRPQCSELQDDSLEELIHKTESSLNWKDHRTHREKSTNINKELVRPTLDHGGNIRNDRVVNIEEPSYKVGNTELEMPLDIQVSKSTKTHIGPLYGMESGKIGADCTANMIFVPYCRVRTNGSDLTIQYSQIENLTDSIRAGNRDFNCWYIQRDSYSGNSLVK